MSVRQHIADNLIHLGRHNGNELVGFNIAYSVDRHNGRHLKLQLFTYFESYLVRLRSHHAVGREGHSTEIVLFGEIYPTVTILTWYRIRQQSLSIATDSKHETAVHGDITFEA